MRKRVISIILMASLLIGIMLLPSMTNNVYASNAYKINGVTVHWDDYTSAPDECWAYANNIYNKIWGQRFSNQFNDSSNSLRNLSDSELTLTASHLKAYVSHAALGSCLRICNSEYLHGSDGWGHSLIIVQKDNDGFTVFEGGLGGVGYPYCREKYYTWSSFMSTGYLGGTYSYIKYIKWPGAPAYPGGGSSDDTLSISGHNYPTSLDVGKTFSIYGTVSSGSSNITSLTVGVYNTSGTLQTGKTVSPNARTYNIANVDNYILFNNLSAGTYYYRITATNTSGTKQLLNKQFTVGSIGEHEHVRGLYIGEEDYHPHYSCYKCSLCGEIYRDYSEPNYWDTCLKCNRPEKPTIGKLNKTYTDSESIKFTWTTDKNTTHTNFWIQKKDDNGEWAYYSKTDYAKSGITQKLPVGEYRVCVVATNSNYWEEDGSTWLYSESDFSYFSVVKPDMWCTDINLPDQINAGQSFQLKGNICGNNGVKWYAIVLYNSAEEVILNIDEAVWKVENTNKYSINTLAKDVKFASLAPGKYSISIESMDNNNNYYEAYYKEFEIKCAQHTYSEITTKPTCTQQGFTTYTCTQCGNTYKGNETATLGHSWDSGKVTTEATEEKEGVRTYTCTRCSTTRTETIPVLEHKHSYQKNVVAPTCTAKGYTTYTCSCGDSYQAEETAALGHAWDSGKVTTEPTEEKEGVRTFTCTRCGETRTEVIPPKDHVHSYTAVITRPTCTEQGYTRYACACGDSYTADKTVALGHSWDNGKITTEPTEDCEGVRTYTCTRCSETKTEPIPQKDHVHSYTAVITKPTCTEQGYTIYTCTCGHNYQADKTAALGHDYEAEVTEPTCTEIGYTTYTCIRCSDSYTGSEKAALGHAWGEGVETVKPTQTESGIRTYTCTRCEETKAESIPPLSHKHSFAEQVTPPTCTEAGYTTYICACGESYKDAYTDALKHSYADGLCVRCGAKDPDYVDPKPGHICPSENFTDVPAFGDWSHNGIDYCVEHELMNGTGNGLFNPNGTVSRAQLVTILYRVAGSPTVTTSGTFSDVPAGQWYSNAIEWAAANGVVNGIGNGKFGPDQSITREQIATILYRYENQPAVSGDLNSFPDQGSVSGFAVTGLIWATQEGLITGVSSNGTTTLAPKNNATRAQIASIIMRYLES